MDVKPSKPQAHRRARRVRCLGRSDRRGIPTIVTPLIAVTALLSCAIPLGRAQEVAEEELELVDYGFVSPCAEK